MKKALMISYVFPPMAAVGGYRVIKFCKFLPEFGWQPVVLTVREGFNFAYDHQLLSQVDKSLALYRSVNWEPLTWWDLRSSGEDQRQPKTQQGTQSNATSRDEQPSISARLKGYVKRLISIPDRNNFWVPFGVWTGLQAVRNENIDIIFSTSPPASAHVIGHDLSVLTGKPLVVDFRDLWTQNEGYESRRLSPLQSRFDRWLEKRAINRSRAVISATDTFGQLLRQNNPECDPSKVFTITNGVDADDFANLDLPDKKNDRFVILHLGSLYGNRNPVFFFETLSKWADSRPEVVSKVQVEFIGNARDYEHLATVSPLNKMVSFVGHIPNQEVLPRLWQADLLLLILGFDAGAAGVLPAKLFEYVCTGRPILAFVPEGEAQRVLDEYSSGGTLTSPDAAKTIESLNRSYDQWLQSGKVRESKIKIPPQYDRRQQAQKLAGIFDSIYESL